MKSSPGPDGLTSKLYKTFTDDFCSILAKVFNHFVHGGKLPNSFCLAIIKLIPKSENALAVQDFRPISLMNTDAKIFAHVVCNRMKNDFVNFSQSLITEIENWYLKKILRAARSLFRRIYFNVNRKRFFRTQFCIIQKTKEIPTFHRKHFNG